MDAFIHYILFYKVWKAVYFEVTCKRIIVSLFLTVRDIDKAFEGLFPLLF